MNLNVEDRVYPNPTEEVVKAGLSVLPEDGGVAILEDGDGFMQTRREPCGYRVEQKDPETNIFFEVREVVDLITLSDLFISYLRRDAAWKTKVEWHKAACQLDSSEPSAEDILARANSYEHPALVEARSRVDELTRANASIAESAKDSTQLVTATGQKQLSCTRCGSVQVTANNKGYGAMKGLAGLFVAGPAGLLAGFLGKNKVLVTCVNCGHSWRAGSWLR